MTRFSIIIPVYNEPDGIDTTLRSLVEQDHDSFELIPVNNNSKDDTPSVIQNWAERYPEQIFPAVEREIQSSYAARNTGIETAQGELFVFIDADMTVPSGWLERIDAAFRDNNVDYLGYDIELQIPDGEEGYWAWYNQQMGLPARWYFDHHQYVPTSALAVRHSVFDHVGLFNEELVSGGDKKFGRKVHDHPELTMAFTDDIVVYHPARTSFKDLYTKSMRLGRGKAQELHLPDSSERESPTVWGVLVYALPPSPLRILEIAETETVQGYLGLYLGAVVYKYLQVLGTLRHLRTADG